MLFSLSRFSGSEVAQQRMKILNFYEEYGRKPLKRHLEQTGRLSAGGERGLGKRHRFFYQRAGKVYHDPNSKWAQNRVRKTKRLKIRHPMKPEDFGI